VLERRAIQLTIEQKALEKEPDAKSKARVEEIKQDLANLRERSTD